MVGVSAVGTWLDAVMPFHVPEFGGWGSAGWR